MSCSQPGANGGSLGLTGDSECVCVGVEWGCSGWVRRYCPEKLRVTPGLGTTHTGCALSFPRSVVTGWLFRIEYWLLWPTLGQLSPATRSVVIKAVHLGCLQGPGSGTKAVALGLWHGSVIQLCSNMSDLGLCPSLLCHQPVASKGHNSRPGLGNLLCHLLLCLSFLSGE